MLLRASRKGGVRSLNISVPFILQSVVVKNKSSKRHLITAFKFGLSIAILWYLFHLAAQDDEFENFFARQKQWGWIGLGFLGTIGAHLFGFYRWRVMVRALDIPFTLIDAIRIGFIGVLFNMVTVGVIGGDALRAFYVTRQVKDRTPEVISSVVADRIIGLLTMFSVASTMFLFLDTTKLAESDAANLNKVFRVVLVLTSLGYLGILAIFFAPWITQTRIYQTLMKLPKFGELINKLTSVLLMYRTRPGAVAFCFLLSLGVNLCFAIAIYSIAVGTTDTHPSFADHFVIEPIAMVSNAAPLPGGIGGMESAMQLLYGVFGSTSGLIVAFGFRFSLLFVAIIGAVFWLMNRSKVSNLMNSTAQEPKK